MNSSPPLLEVTDLKVHFPVKPKMLRKTSEWVKAVDGVSFELAAGETLGLVGESGCGKTSLGRALMRLLPPTSGSILLDGEDITHWDAAKLRPLRRKWQMIFQDPFNSLDPRMTVGHIVGEALEIHCLAATPKEQETKVRALLESVGLNAADADSYPHEFSGGQRQRIGIARALAVDPKLIICDEPVSALDVSVQAQIVNLLQDLQEQRGVAYLFIAHDVAVVERISRRIMVMYLGKVVEIGPSAEVVGSPKHPYTQALIAAVPELNPSGQRSRAVAPGEMPSPIHPPPGCPFHPRCPIAEDRCRRDVPALREIRPGHAAACHLAT